MFNHFLLLQYLLYINPTIGLKSDLITPHCFVFDGGSTIRSCNRVCNYGTPDAEEIDHIKLFFGNKHFTWVVDSNDHQTLTALQKNDFHYKASFPAMILYLDSLSEISYPSQITVKEIQSTSNDLNAWLSIVAESFKVEYHELQKTIALFQQDAGNSVKLYCGSCQEKPVAACMLMLHNDTASLHWVCTLSDFRNKGIGLAITMQALLDAQHNGCIYAILLSSVLGKHVYERIGFQEYAHYDIYGNY